MGTRSRTWDEWLLVRVPGVMRIARWAFERLPSGSNAKRRQLERGMRSQFEAINRADFELFLMRCQPDAVFHVADIAPEGLMLDFEPVYRGHEGIRSFFRQWVESWDHYRVDLNDVVYADGERVVVAIGRQAGRMRAGGPEVQRPVAFVVTFQSALAVDIRAFWDPAQALAAARRSGS